MKKFLIIGFLFASLSSFGQIKKDSTISLPIKKDTVDVSSVKFLRTKKGIFIKDLLDNTDYFLTKDQIEELIIRIGVLPYNESEKAIAIIRKIFGLK